MFGKEILLMACCETQLRAVQWPLFLAAICSGICWNHRRKLVKVEEIFLRKESPRVFGQAAF